MLTNGHVFDIMLPASLYHIHCSKPLLGTLLFWKVSLNRCGLRLTYYSSQSQFFKYNSLYQRTVLCDFISYPQVSLIFLLYGNNPMNAKFGLQRLLILYHGQRSQTTDIHNWILSQSDSHWRQTIIEALWTIKANHVLQSVRLQSPKL